MRYAVAFLIIAAMFAWMGWGVLLSAGVPGVPLLHAAAAFALLAATYLFGGPGWLLKRADGRRPWWAWIPWGPVFGFNGLSAWLHRAIAGREPHARVTDRLFFGRRLTARELGDAGWERVLDLAAEFPATRTTTGYRSLPVLDAMPPTGEQLRSAVEWINEGLTAGPVYVHCAFGHGRSACVVIAWLLAAGEVTTVEEGERRLKTLRPGVRLTRAQADALRPFERGRRRGAGGT